MLSLFLIDETISDSFLSDVFRGVPALVAPCKSSMYINTHLQTINLWTILKLRHFLVYFFIPMIDLNSFHPLLFLFSSLLCFVSSFFISLNEKAHENKNHYFRISKKGIITQRDHHQHNPPFSSVLPLIVEWNL